MVRRPSTAAPDPPPAAPIEDDLVLLLQACAAVLGERVLADVVAATGAPVRFADGYVFQHLLGGPLAVSELARRLGVTQQAASKQVADMEARGLAVRTVDADDARARPVAMSPRAWRAVEAARSSRAAIAAETAASIGADRTRQLVRTLRRIGDATGALDRMQRRQLRPESTR